LCLAGFSKKVEDFAQTTLLKSQLLTQVSGFVLFISQTSSPSRSLEFFLLQDLVVADERQKN
jgi:hypothetical protein